MADPEDPFLARWSRRKRDTRRDRPAPDAKPERRDSDAAAAPAEDKAPATVVESGAAESGVAEAGVAEAGVAEPGTAAEELPDIDSLDKTSDFTVFLKEGVPEAIRRKALRRLWRTDPVLANLDGLNDYDEDFKALGMVAGHLKTLYKVGKGYLDDEDEAPADEVSVARTAGKSGEATNGGSETDSLETDSPETDSPETDSPETDSPETAGPDPVAADSAPQSVKLRAEKMQSGKLRPGKSPGRSARNRRWGGFAS